MIVPLDGNMSYDFLESFFERANWQLKFALLPRRCMFSDKIIWLELAYRGVGIWTGPGDSIIETRWATKDEYLIWRLKH